MARKSRTQPKQSPDTLNVLSKVYKTAIYVRLSAEKDETRDRKTLINQRNLIKNFVDQQMDMEIHDIYMDDEISGTTFDLSLIHICLMMELIILKRKLKLMRKMKNAFLILLPYMVINIPKVV